MGKIRGKRNAAREKVWPGERADKLRAAKRDTSLYNGDGTPNWKAAQDEANKLLPDLPLIEFGDRIQSQTAVYLGTRHFKKIAGKPVAKFTRALDAPKKTIDKKIAKLEKRIDHAYAALPPLRATPIEARDLKHPTEGNVCDRCQGPRGGPPAAAAIFKQKHYCAACYRLNAIDRRASIAKSQADKKEKFLAQVNDYRSYLLQRRGEVYDAYFAATKHIKTTTKKAARAAKVRDEAILELNEVIDGYNYWVEDFSLCIKKEMPAWDGQNWDSPIAQQKMKEGTSTVLIRSCPDFSDALLDAIEEAELFTGIPYAKWSRDEISKWIAPAGQRKRLFSDPFEAMVPRRKAANRVRQATWSTASRGGKLLKAAA